MKFTAFGLARSGTTALAQLLNAHPEVFCAIEAILPDKKITNLDFPGAFLSPEFVGDKRAAKHKELITDKHKCFGNKFPRYYAYLDVIGSKDIPNFGIYREGFSFVHSWNQRVKARENWQQGRTGIIGVIEQIILLLSLVSLKNKENTYMFSYEKLLQLTPDHFERIFDILGVEANLAQEKFEKKIFRQEKVINVVREFTEQEEFAKKFFQIEDIDELMKKYSGQSIAAYDKSAIERIASLKPKLGSFIQKIEGILSSVERDYLKSQMPFFEKAIQQKIEF